LNSYKEAVAVGAKFIAETEAALLRVQAIKKQIVLKPTKE
jgi:hypothetical protein